MKKSLKYSLAFLLSIMFLGCSTHQQTNDLLPKDGQKFRMERAEFVDANGGGGELPKWFKRPADFAGGGMVAVKTSQGYIDILNNYSIMKIKATERARVEVAKILDKYVKIVEYIKTKDTQIQNKFDYAQATDSNTKINTDIPADAVIIKNEYINKQGTIFVLAVLDPSFMKNFLKDRNIKDEELMQAHKEYMKYSDELIEDAKKELNN